MSLYGAMNTAISGLGAQSAAFANISDNVANSQTIGFKRIDTSFIDYLTNSNATTNDSGAVSTRPDYVNDVQGTIAQSDNPLALAIAGQGFFPVSHQDGSVSGQPTFSDLQRYTRAGDFKLDKNGYLANSAGEFLNGWSVDAVSGAVDRNAITPIRVDQSVYHPQATSTVSLAANLPATPATGSTVSSQVNIYDALGQSHSVQLTWTQLASDDWGVAIGIPDDTSGTTTRSAEVKFGAASGNAVAEGTVGSLGSGVNVTTNSFTGGSPASLSFDASFGGGPSQTITLNLGNYGQTNGLTQYAGTTYTLRGITQNGVPPGSFASLSTTSSGDIVANYDNGQSRTIARVPVITFSNPNALQRQDGQSFTATQASGDPLANDAGSSGAGSLATGSVEQSNVDIATEFSKLIVAQRAYTANTKMVTTADELLQQTIDMKR